MNDLNDTRVHLIPKNSKYFSYQNSILKYVFELTRYTRFIISFKLDVLKFRRFSDYVQALYFISFHIIQKKHQTTASKQLET